MQILIIGTMQMYFAATKPRSWICKMYLCVTSWLFYNNDTIQTHVWFFSYIHQNNHKQMLENGEHFTQFFDKHNYTCWNRHNWCPVYCYVQSIAKTRVSWRMGKKILRSRYKGQLISECLFDVLNFPKNQRKIWQLSTQNLKSGQIIR